MNAPEVARRFGLGRVVRVSDEPVARGRQGAVWRLETTGGEWAVKTTFDPVGEDDVRPAARFQEEAHRAGVPTPGLQRSVTGEVFATVEGRRLRVYEWVDLRPPDPGLDPALVGATLAAIHRVVVPAGGPPEAWYREPVGARRWDRLIGELRAAGAPFAARLAGLRDELVALESWIEPPETLQTCHRDLWADNLLPTADGGVCVIDWENSGPADPAQELGCVLFEFGRGDIGRARELLAAYRDAGGPARLTRCGHFSMLIAQLGHIAEIAGTDWLRPNRRTPDRAEAAAWIGEVLADPHTRDSLYALLCAAREIR